MQLGRSRSSSGSRPVAANGFQSKRAPSTDGVETRTVLYDAARPLLKAGADDPDEESVQNFQRVLEGGASPHQWSGPETPLLRAVQVGSSEMVRLLIQFEADPTSKDSQGVSMLHTAVFRGHLAICEMLLNHKAEVDAVDRHGQTPMFFAADKEMCVLLYNAHADPSIMNLKGQTALHLAARAGFGNVLMWLTEHVSRMVMDLQDIHGATATYYARAAGLKQHVVHRVATFEPDFSMVSGRQLEGHAHYAAGFKVPKGTATPVGAYNHEKKGGPTSHIVSSPAPGSARSRSSPAVSEESFKERTRKPATPSPSSKPATPSPSVRSPPAKSPKPQTPKAKVPKAASAVAMLDIKLDLQDAVEGKDLLLSKGRNNRQLIMHTQKALQEQERLRRVQENEQKKHAQAIKEELAKERRLMAKERDKHRVAHEKDLAKMKEEIEQLKKLKAEAEQGQQAMKELEKVKEELKEIKEAKFQALQLVQEIKERETQKEKLEAQRRVDPTDRPMRQVKSGFEQFPDSPMEEGVWRIRNHSKPRGAPLADTPEPPSPYRNQRGRNRGREAEESREDQMRGDRLRRQVGQDRQERPETPRTADRDAQGSSKGGAPSREEEAAAKIQALARKSILANQDLPTEGKRSKPPQREHEKENAALTSEVARLKKELEASESRQKLLQEEKEESGKASPDSVKASATPRPKMKSPKEERRERVKQAQASERKKKVEKAKEPDAADEERAVKLIQKNYRASIVKQTLKESPSEGAWSLTKALRNQLAVRDYKAMQEKKDTEQKKKVEGTYRSSIAEKILEMEDKQFAAKKQAERFDIVFRWEALTRGMWKLQAQARGAAAIKWVSDQRHKSKEEKKKPGKPKATVEQLMLRKYHAHEEEAAVKIQARVRGKQARNRVKFPRISSFEEEEDTRLGKQIDGLKTLGAMKQAAQEGTTFKESGIAVDVKASPRDGKVAVQDTQRFLEEARNIFKTLDRDSSGKVNRIELIKGLKESPDVRDFFGLPAEIRQEDTESRRRLEEIFQRIDKDNDKWLTMSELEEWVRQQRAAPDQGAALPMMSLEDKAGSQGRRRSRFNGASSVGDYVQVVHSDSIDAILAAWCGPPPIDESFFSKVYAKESNDPERRSDVHLLCLESFAYYTHTFTFKVLDLELDSQRRPTWEITLVVKGEEKTFDDPCMMDRYWSQLFPVRESMKDQPSWPSLDLELFPETAYRAEPRKPSSDVDSEEEEEAVDAGESF